MVKNKKYAERLQELKILRVKDKRKFKIEMQKAIAEIGISRATLYRDLGKKNLMRKSRSDAGKDRTPVTLAEKKMMSELMLAGHTKQEAAKIIEERLGEKISTRKSVKIKTDVEVDKSSFSSEAKKFIDKILELDLMAPEAGLYFKYKGIAFKVDKNYLEDVALILATAYNDTMGQPVLNVDREQMIRTQLFHLMQEAMRIANDNYDLKIYRELTRMYKDLKQSRAGEVGTDFHVVEKAMKILRPDLTREEIISILIKAGGE